MRWRMSLFIPAEEYVGSSLLARYIGRDYDGFVSDFLDEEVSCMQPYLANQRVPLCALSLLDIVSSVSSHSWLHPLCQDSEYVYCDQKLMYRSS